MGRFALALLFISGFSACATYEAKPMPSSLSNRSVAVVVKYSNEIAVELNGGPLTSDVRRTVDAKPLAIAEAILSKVENELRRSGHKVMPGIANANDDQLRDGAHIGNVRIDRIGKRKEQIRNLSSALAADLILVITPQAPLGNRPFVRGLAVHQLSAFGRTQTAAYAAFDLNLSDGRTGSELSWTYQTVSYPLGKVLDEQFIDVPSNVLGLMSRESWTGLALATIPEGLRSIGLTSHRPPQPTVQPDGPASGGSAV